MGKIMDFIKGESKSSEFANNTTKYTLYDSYPTEYRCNVYAVSLKRAGKQTKVIEKNNEYQLWWRD